jgi:hypothetical protein
MWALWFGTWHLEASRFFVDWAEKIDDLDDIRPRP